MNRPFRAVWLALSSLLLIILPLRQADTCGFYPDWEETRALLFNPALSDNAGLEPFYFSRHFFYTLPGDRHAEDAARNVNEWQTYLGGTAMSPDIKQVLTTDADFFLTLYADRLLADTFTDNLFIQKLLEPSHRPALDYLAFAKRIEFVNAADDDPWLEYTGPQSWDQRDTTFLNRSNSLAALADTALVRLAAAPDVFLKKRYAYQAVVCLRYAGRGSEAVSTFDANFSDRDTTVLYPWAMLHKAECLTDSNQSAYCLSRVFDLCQSKKVRVWNLFPSARAETIARLGRNPAERATILTLGVIQYPGHALPKLQRIARTDWRCRYLPMLITREINKLEDWLVTREVSGIEPRETPAELYESTDDYKDFQRVEARWLRKNYQKDRAYARQFRNWLSELEHRNTLPGQRDFLRLALAHLYAMEHQPKKAQALLARISRRAAPRLRAQKAVEEVLLAPLVSDVRRLAVQQKLAARLRDIERYRGEIERPERLLAQLSLHLYHAFFEKKDIPIAGLLYNKSAYLTAVEANADDETEYYKPLAFFDAHASVRDMDRLLRLAHKPRPTAFEAWLLKPVPKPSVPIEDSHAGDDDYFYMIEWAFQGKDLPSPMPKEQALLDLQGTIAFREGDLRRAYKIFSRLPADYWRTTYEFGSYLGDDPFGGANKLAYEAGDSIPASKAAVVKRFLDLAADARTSRARRAEDYYLLGNGWYNCSYFGNSWMMFAYGQAYSESDEKGIRDAVHFSASPDPRRHGPAYYRLSRAQAFYQKALAARPAPELAAKATFMLAFCRFKIAEMEGKEGPHSPLFRQWARRYTKTATYADVLEHCPELKDYLAGK